MLRAPLRTAKVGGLSALMLAAFSAEERVRGMSDERRQAYVRRWARSVRKILGVELDVLPGGAKTGEGGPQLVVANHRSTLDILVVLELFGGELLARKDMENWPAIGPLARRAGTLFVERESPSSGASAVRRMCERLRQNVTLCVFPEGTTFAGDQVRTFRRGAFLAVARERGKIVPVGLAYEQPEAVYGDEPVLDHMKRLVSTPKFRVCVAVGSPRPADALSITELAEQAQSEVQRLVDRARHHLRGPASKAVGTAGAP
jgi:1-acyl-sn-glycerol-3-phosphate acyltransferase